MLTTNDILGDRYQLERSLGHQYGRRTWLAQDSTTQQPVVLKILMLGPEFDWQDHKLLEREAQLLQQLDHPAIPKHLDYFDLDLPECKGFVLVQNYIDAPSLADWLERGRTFSTEEVQQLAGGLLKILIYLHQQHPPIIHRDIKPSNILLGSRSGHSVGDVYLVDFGAVQTAPSSGTRTIVGSYGYMPLEQFGGRASPSSDLYSLGMSLIEVITGTPPTDWLDENHSPSIPLNTHPVLASWLQWLTQPHPKNRPSSTRLALESLQAIPDTVNEAPKSLWMRHVERKQWFSEAVGAPSPIADSRLEIQRRPGELTITAPYRPRPVLGIVGGLCCSSLLVLGCVNVVLYIYSGLSSTEAGLSGILSAITNFEFLLNFAFSTFFSGGVMAMFLMATFFGAYYCFGELAILERKTLHLSRRGSQWQYHYRILRRGWSRSEHHPVLQSLVYVPSYITRNDDGKNTRISAKLELQMGHRKMTMQHLCSLSETELQWIAQDISNWLNIPYTTVATSPPAKSTR